jgi:hypothetical protein
VVVAELVALAAWLNPLVVAEQVAEVLLVRPQLRAALILAVVVVLV